MVSIKTVSLNGDLIEEVYMKPPLGYNPNSNKVYQLHRTLYGLKQAFRAWYSKFNSTMKRLGFNSSL